MPIRRLWGERLWGERLWGERLWGERLSFRALAQWICALPMKYNLQHSEYVAPLLQRLIYRLHQHSFEALVTWQQKHSRAHGSNAKTHTVYNFIRLIPKQWENPKWWLVLSAQIWGRCVDGEKNWHQIKQRNGREERNILTFSHNPPQIQIIQTLDFLLPIILMSAKF